MNAITPIEAQTYARRYGLQMAFGLATEDDVRWSDAQGMEARASTQDPQGLDRNDDSPTAKPMRPASGARNDHLGDV